uniref:Conotoxin Cap15b n=1 Tax=Conus capitaneus TaxID=89439 RepID=CO2FB_CONCE|nr:RecName: Full=Conotoxin Cap15b; Flags: Precursor [Conus capitaneus]ACV07671.1 XV conotoxin Cap15b precursor [Conus capitaneus]
MEKLTFLILVATVLLTIHVLVQSDGDKHLKRRPKQYATKRLSALMRGHRQCTPQNVKCEEDDECCSNLECKCSTVPDCNFPKCRP